MAGLVRYKEKDLNELDVLLVNLGYRQMSQKEVDDIYKNLGLVVPRSQPDPRKNIPYVYTSSYLKVILWTTFDRETRETIEGRCAWGIIVSGNERIIASPQIRRMKNFKEKLIMWAGILHTIAKHRPLCDHCCAYMTLNKEDNENIYWECLNKNIHPTSDIPMEEYEVFVKFLCDEEEEFWEKWKKERKAYLRWRENAGLVVHKIGGTRNKWGIENLHNLKTV